ncbi:MAG: Ig-like domain-containing protein, partial [Anaerolineae bacterium]
SRGDENTAFEITARADGGAQELRLLDGERVLAAGEGPQAELPVVGSTLGVGRTGLRVEALYADGSAAQSARVEVEVAAADPDAPPPDVPRRAFAFTADAVPGRPSILELPFVSPAADSKAVVQTGPTQGTLARAGDTVILQPPADAAGVDGLTFVVSDTVGASLPATVTIRYCPAPRVVAPPRDTVACAGTTAVLGTSAAGDNLTFQWYREGRPIPGAQAPRLEIPWVAAEDAGRYGVVIRNWCRRVANALRPAEATLAVVSGGPECHSRAFIPRAMKEAP